MKRDEAEKIYSVSDGNANHSFALGRGRRRGLDAVRQELFEKAIAYSRPQGDRPLCAARAGTKRSEVPTLFWRLDDERRRQAEEADAPPRKRSAA